MSQLTLAWAVNQSRRVFRAKKKQVHPEDVSSAGTDGGGSSYHGSPAKSRGVGIGNQRRAKKPGCLGALMALMGFGRGGSKVRAAARQMRRRRAGDPNNRPPGSPGFGPPASPLSRGGLLSSGGSSSRMSGFKSPVSPSPMPRPELDTAGHRPRSTGAGLDGRAASRGQSAEHLEGGMGYRDADVFSMGGATSSREFNSTPHRKSRLGPAAPPPSIASGFEERLDEDELPCVDDDSAPRIGTPGRATSMGNASWTQPG